MKKANPTYISICALILAVIALVMCTVCCIGGKYGKKGDFSKKISMVERALMEKPEIIISAMNQYQMQMQEQAMANAQRAIDENINAINNDPNSPVLGNPRGTIVLVEFFDYACGYCHRIFPVIQNILKNNNDVKFVAKELAFVSQASEYAAMAAWAAHEQGKYEAMNAALLENKEPLTKERIDAIAAKIGLDVAKMKASMESDRIRGMMRANNELAEKIRLQGVPMLLLNGKVLQTFDEGVIQAEIERLRKK